MDLNTLKLYYNKANTELEQSRPLMEQLYRYGISSKNTWNGYTNNPGERTDIDTYNSQPLIVVKQFAASLLNLTIPSGTRFFNIGTRDEVDNPDEFAIETQPVADTIMEHLNVSNFYQAFGESFIDVAGGTGGVTINFDTDKKQLYFTSLDISKVAFLEDHMGNISYVFRRLGITDKITQKLLFPDIDFGSINSLDLLEIIYPEGNNYAYVITDTTFSKIYKKTLSETNPFIIFRWSKRPNENRGRGILHDLIGLLKMTNTMVGDILDAAEVVISPPIVAGKSSGFNINNSKIEPGSIITVDDMNGIKQFPITPNLPFGLEYVNINNKTIEDAFLNPASLLSDLNNKEMTATEVQARLQLANSVYGANYNRMQRELMTPMLLRVINLLEKAGIIQSISMTSDGKTKRKLKLTYNSPLVYIANTAKIQNTMKAIQTIVQATGDMTYINSGFKLEEFPFKLTEGFGGDLSLVNTIEQTKNNIKVTIQQKQAEKAMQMQQASNPALTAPINTGVFNNAR